MLMHHRPYWYVNSDYVIVVMCRDCDFATVPLGALPDIYRAMHQHSLVTSPDNEAEIAISRLGTPPQRSAKARSASTGAEDLLILAHDPRSHVRSAVARHANTFDSTRAMLSGDDDVFVRRAVAASPHTPPHILLTCAGDKDITVKNAALDNPNIPINLYYRISGRLRL